MGNREEYLAPDRRDIGRRIGDQQHEMFVVCDPSEAMQQQFQQWSPDFIAIHDLATDSSPRILAGLAAATGRKVQKLVIRRQGHGVALATLDFAELPGGKSVELDIVRHPGAAAVYGASEGLSTIIVEREAPSISISSRMPRASMHTPQSFTCAPPSITPGDCSGQKRGLSCASFPSSASHLQTNRPGILPRLPPIT